MIILPFGHQRLRDRALKAIGMLSQGAVWIDRLSGGTTSPAALNVTRCVATVSVVLQLIVYDRLLY